MAGGGLPAVWKTELLVAAGAQVHVFASDPVAEMIALAATLPEGSVAVVNRPWQPSDLVGTALAIGALALDKEAEAFRVAAKAAGVPVNVIDKPAFCDFQFGTVVARSPLVIGISTDGASPVFGQALRARIEAILPPNVGRWAQAAKDWRPSLMGRDLTFRQRRQFWEMFAARALSGAGDPTPADRAACSAAVQLEDSGSAGRVTLVGCDTLSRGSLTLDGVAALQSADLVGYDSDVGEAIIGFARREAARRELASDIHLASETLAALWISGKNAVWLGAGDPRGDVRWLQRRDALRLHGIDAVILPGVTTCEAWADRTPGKDIT